MSDVIVMFWADADKRRVVMSDRPYVKKELLFVGVDSIRALNPSEEHIEIDLGNDELEIVVPQGLEVVQHDGVLEIGMAEPAAKVPGERN